MPSLIRRRQNKKGKITWQVRVPVGVEADGKEAIISETFITENEAKIRVGQILDARNTGAAVKPSDMTLNIYLDKWLKNAAHKTVRENTYQGYETHLRLYIRPHLGVVKLKNLSPLAIQEAVTILVDSGLSSRTVRYSHTILRMALRQGVKWRILPANPAESVSMPKLVQREIRPLTSDEAAELLVASKGRREEMYIELALVSGMRPSELMALQWSDIDLKAGVIRVRRALVQTSDAWVLRPTKSKRGKREIPIPEQTTIALKNHKGVQGEERMRVGSLWNGGGFEFIFTRQDQPGQPLERRGLLNRFKVTAKRAGLSLSVNLYDLRHTCATLMLIAGVNPKVASERLGHSSVALTLDVYSHVLPSMQRDATARLAEVLYRPGGREGATETPVG